MQVLSGRWFRSGGLVVALVGFGVTRLFVAETIRTSASLLFLLAGLLPLVVGLGLTVYGVTLAVGTFSREYVNVVAKWCLLGTGGMLLVLILSSGDSVLAGRGLEVVSESPTLVANVLLGGAVGGVLIGNRSATNSRQRRELRRRANQALLVNRLLRHEVINAATVVRGYATHPTDARSEDGSASAIREEADRIVDTIDEVGDITTEGDGAGTVDLAATVAAEVGAVRDRFPEVAVTYDGPAEGATVRNGHRLDVAFRNLLEYAADAADADELVVELRDDEGEVTVTVSHDGRTLTGPQRALLADGEFPEYDDPTSGFRLQVARLLVTRADGRVRTTGNGAPTTTVAVTVPREDTVPDVSNAIELTRPTLGRAVGAGVLAGVVMGAYVTATSDTMSVIGALYGVEGRLVGWTTHLFHSVIFAVLFAAGCAHGRLQRFLEGTPRAAAAGSLWGAVLWLVAAGVVMPLWLQVVGVPAVLPNFSFPGLVSHLLWGVVLGTSYARFGSGWVPELRSR